MKKIRDVIIIIIIILLMCFIVSRIYIIVSDGSKLKKQVKSNTDMSRSITKKKVNNEDFKTDYELFVENVKSEADDYWYYIKGFIVNKSNENYDGVLIQYDALDADGYKLVTCSDITYNLKSGDSYAFKATCVTDKTKIASYKLYNIMPLDITQ